MKRKLSWLSIIALMFGTFSAFTPVAVHHESKARLTSYYWFNTSGVYHDKKTMPDEQSITGCNSSNSLCENGYDKTQLVDPNNPSAGVKPGELPPSQIFRQ